MLTLSILSIAFSLFLVIDSLGNIPIYMAYLKDFPFNRQRIIIIREMIFALIIMIAFSFLGESLLKVLDITMVTIQVSGGIIIFLIALKMIFPPIQEKHSELTNIEEPFIVPLAIPLIAGPGVLASVMLLSKQQPNQIVMIAGILIAWIASLIVLLLAPYLYKFLGKKGLIAMERLMGLILILIAMEMFLDGISGYIQMQLPIIHRF
ncbi:MAG TPA: YhgN family NAAT transporter [Chlamydiales bacterium]|nr:YhgN family NAAT transporter [Chlamydiales bacterium]